MEIEVSRRQFFALFARGAHGAKNPKKCRGPCWPPAGVRPCAPKERQGGFRIGGAEACGMESGVGAEAFRALDATRRRLPGHSRGFTSERHGEDGGGLPSRDASVRSRTAFPAPLAADMRTGPPAARWFSMRNGYGAAQYVRWEKEASRCWATKRSWSASSSSMP